MLALTDQDLTALRWMVRCNDESGWGYLWPTVKRQGPLAEIEPLVARGLATRGRGEDCGYWITEAGRAALEHPG